MAGAIDKGAYAFQQLIESGRFREEHPVVNREPTASMLVAVFGEPLEVLRPSDIERGTFARLRGGEYKLETQQILVVRLGEERFVKHTSGFRTPLLVE